MSALRVLISYTSMLVLVNTIVHITIAYAGLSTRLCLQALPIFFYGLYNYFIKSTRQ